MSPTDEPTAFFQAERPRLVGLAYRLLGSLTDAEDVVQEAWLRWSTVDHADLERPAAWLTTVTSRIGIDRLRARRRDRVEYVGPWLPEPLLADSVNTAAAPDPADVAALSDSLTTAFLVMLERLTPTERLVILLADVFGESFRSVAEVTGQSEDACRQLAVRARRKIRTADRPSRSRDDERTRAIAGAFLAATLAGDRDAVMALLAPGAVLVSDGGAHRHAARRPVVGPERITRFVTNLVKRLPDGITLHPTAVNGSTGLLVRLDGLPWLVQSFDIVDDLIVRIHYHVNPEKLAAVDRVTALR